MTDLLRIQNCHLEHMIGALMNCREVGVVVLTFQLHHHGNHIDRFLVEVVVRDTLRCCIYSERRVKEKIYGTCTCICIIKTLSLLLTFNPSLPTEELPEFIDFRRSTFPHFLFYHHGSRCLATQLLLVYDTYRDI